MSFPGSGQHLAGKVKEKKEKKERKGIKEKRKKERKEKEKKRKKGEGPRKKRLGFPLAYASCIT